MLPGPLPRRIEPAGSCRSNEEFEEFFALDMTIWNLQLKTLQQKVCVTQNIQEYLCNINKKKGKSNFPLCSE